MDGSLTRKKSLRRNMRQNYKAMLDPLSQKNFDESMKAALFDSLNLQSKSKQKESCQDALFEEPTSTECLFPSYSRTRSGKKKATPKRISTSLSNGMPTKAENIELATSEPNLNESADLHKTVHNGILNGQPYVKLKNYSTKSSSKSGTFANSKEKVEQNEKISNCISVYPLNNSTNTIKDNTVALHSHTPIEEQPIVCETTGKSGKVTTQGSTVRNRKPNKSSTFVKLSPVQAAKKAKLPKKKDSSLLKTPDHTSTDTVLKDLTPRESLIYKSLKLSKSETTEIESADGPERVVKPSKKKRKPSLKTSKIKKEVKPAKPSVKKKRTRKVRKADTPTATSKGPFPPSELQENVSPPSTELHDNIPEDIIEPASHEKFHKTKTKKRGTKSKTIELTNVVSKQEEVPSEISDMPLITFDTSPDLKNKVKLEFAVEKKKTKHRGQGKKKKLRGTAATPKKRGRKRLAAAVESFLDADLSDENSDALTLTATECTPIKKERKKNQRRTGRRFSVTGYWYIAAGYLNDIIHLLEEFDKIPGWRFRDFAQCWRKLSFSLVYRGRQTFKELLEFSEEIMLLTKRFLGTAHTIKRRIGALYTLYGLYCKFPLERMHFFGLRFELQEYKDLLELVQPFRSNIENPDPAYIFRKLELDGSIFHVATACEPCYDFHNEERDHVEMEYGKQRLAKSSAVNMAIPKSQLNAEAELLRHYHSLKTELTGEENRPEKALSMISQDFFEGISSQLSSLRKDTLYELGMAEDLTNALSDTDNVENSVDGSGNMPQVSEQLIETDDPSHFVDKTILDTVNQSENAQLSQKVLEKHLLTQDSAVKEFMRPPTVEDLGKPLRPQTKCKKSKKNTDSSKCASKKTETAMSDSIIEPNDGKVKLDIKSEPAEYQELKEVLYPHPNPPKKKRGRKRPAVLLKAASYSPRKKSLPTPPQPSTRSVNSCTSKDLFDENTPFATPLQGSATCIQPSELKEEKPVVMPSDTIDDTTVIKVRMRANNIRKTIKLKVKVNLKQFKEMQHDSVRFANFKNKLRPLIKSTQKGENKSKEWIVEDIELVEETSQSPPSFKMERTSPRPPPSPPHSPRDPLPRSSSTSDSPGKIPFRQRFECLKYSDGEDNEDISEDEDFIDDIPKGKRKTQDEKDVDFELPKDTEEEDDVLEYEDDGAFDDYDLQEWEPFPYKRWWKRTGHSGRSYWCDYEFEERGPRDSDQLLKPRNNKKVSMVPMQIGGTIKYFPLISTGTNSEKSKEAETPESEVRDQEDVTDVTGEKEEEEGATFPTPNPSEGIYTWNDFSSDKFPPFKKRKRSNGFPYILPPRSPKKKRKSSSELTKMEEEEDVKPTKLTVIRPYIPPERIITNTLEPDCEIKKESSTVFEELAEDWSEDPLNDSEAEELKCAPRDSNGLAPSTHENRDYEEEELEPPNCLVLTDGITMTDDSPIIKEEDKTVHGTSSGFDQNDCKPVSYTEFSEVDEAFPKSPHMFHQQSIPVSEVPEYQNNIDVPVNVDNDMPFNMHTNEQVLPRTFLVNDTTAISSHSNFESNSLIPITSFPTESLNLAPSCTEELKPSFYYKVTASDGNEIFVPLSALPPNPSKGIEILSFDMVDVKPFSHTKNASNMAPLYNEEEQYSVPPYDLSSSYQEDNGTQYEEDSPEADYSTHFPRLPNEAAKPGPSYIDNSPSKLDCTTSGPSYTDNSCKSSNTKSTSEPSYISNSPCKLDMVKSSSSTPSCSFLFSPKFSSLRKLPTAIGEASGKVPSPEKPKVKFLFKGLLKSFKKH